MIPLELLSVGLRQDAPRPYAAIAAAEAALVERSGLLGLGGAFAGRQLVARFFLGTWGTKTQRAAWLEPIAAGRGLASVAISEPGIGAHPKHLSTRAERTAAGWRITGRKAWVSNGPLASVFVVLAVTAEQAGRKRYSAFLVPRETPGLSVAETEEYRALPPSRHCLLTLDGCEVDAAALLGAEGTAYEAMALPFRDVEDAVGLSGLAGACRFLTERLRAQAGDDAARTLELGGLVALTAVLSAGAAAVAEALDAGRLAERAAEAIGLRLLAAEITARAERLVTDEDAAIAKVLADLAASGRIARGARAARQARLAQASAGSG